MVKKWLEWMKDVIFSSQISILVNGSPTKDFEAHMGLRQGDPISPFLFVIVVEGLVGLLRNTSEIGVFKGFNFKGLCNVDLL